MAYEKMKKEELILRDELAIQRTKLAEERTYLAYIRTGITVAMGGIFFVGYFKEGIFAYVGYLAVLLGIVFFGYGTYKHRKSQQIIKKMNGFIHHKK
jgi:putative membrane protein